MLQHDGWPNEEVIKQIFSADVIVWLRRLQAHAKFGPQHLLRMAIAMRPYGGYRVKTMMIAVKIAGLLRVNSELKRSLSLPA